MPRFSKARKTLVDTMMKETIYEAAASVLSKHGIQGTTMDRVAAAANVAKSSLYDYFESKDELLRFINTRLVEPFFQTMEESLTETCLPSKTGRDTPRELGTQRQGKGHHSVAGGDRSENQEIRRGIRPRFLRLLTGIFAKAFERAHSDRTTPRIRAACFSGVFRSCSSCRRRTHRARKCMTTLKR